MKMQKKEMKNVKGSGKKYDGFAIASFVIGLFILLNFALAIISFFIDFEDIRSLEFFIFLFSTGLIFPVSLASIILGIVALVKIKKNRLKGKIFSIIGIIISALIFLLYLLLSFSIYPG